MEAKSFINGFRSGLSDILVESSFGESEAFNSDFYDGLIEQLKEAELCDSYSPLFYRDVDQPPPKKLKCKSKCPECLVEFASYKGLMQHKAKIHDRLVKTVPCNQCGKCFKHKYALEFHVRQVHEKSTRVQCGVCLKILYNKYAYKSHLKAKHGGQGGED
mmetsp:Transcript_32733/g.56977  ORF Transcript_32733/g.56977 Transcript_32733/m.56977 type:complete len:160 (+) Transcript_32733:1060-1539(+)|eukprot:CAMPEP_0204917094 /NCGR_PEP_ID=MMETSP1397-20131031/14771_1 /ASSEMBLY_ACC=CAM_ASM_000891 /TAXON_ID=49980 /ORGANISM="Climacostomum Climacostomum virens, Strain Stock W-24" /LENGTH=159 /DNA_ID=CAMNT_0052089845 /DNA_START=1008 /DNA_END=1487 /DNA_ORIENTATION=-